MHLNLTILMERLKVLSLLSSNSKLILLHKGLEALPKASKYDLVLSPQFYISKRENVPVKYAFQAKKLAPSILEELLPNEYEYEYLVKKDGDSWLFFAYAPKEIEDFLKKCCNVDGDKIGKIYFADQLKNVLKKVPLGIDEHNALTLLNSKATIVPRSMIDSNKYAKFSQKLRPKVAFNFKPSSKVSKDAKITKDTIVLASLVALLGVAFIIEGLSYKNAVKKEESKLSAIYEDYPQLQSKMTRDSIKSKYQKIEQKERKIRDLIDTFSQLTSKKSILDKLELQNDKLIAQFNVNPKEINKIKKIAKSAKLKVIEVNNSLIRVEGRVK